MVALDSSDLAAGCRLATPWVSSCRLTGPVHTRCDLDGQPPSLTAHYADPLPAKGVRLFSTADPPEVACDIMLLSEAPPTREAWLLENGEVAELTWKFSSEQGLLAVHCRAQVVMRPTDARLDFGRYHVQALSTIPGVMVLGMAGDAAAEAFLRQDVRSLPLLVACAQAGVQLDVAARYLLHHVGTGPEHDAEIVKALTFLSPAVLRGLLPRIDDTGLRGALEDALLSQLQQPRSWLEPRLVERIALFTGPQVDAQVLDILQSQSSPWIAWWLMAQAMEATGNVPLAGRLACGALEKLPSSMKTIELLARCGGEDAIDAVAQAVAWMRMERWHMLDAAETILARMCPHGDREARIEAARGILDRGTHSASRVHSRR